MKNNEALQILKSALEMPGFTFTANFNEIVNSMSIFVIDKRILNEIERNNLGEALILIDNYLFDKTAFKKFYFLSALERFDFDEEVGLTIDEIKNILKVGLLEFQTVKDLLGNITSYCQHWENQRRINVRIERTLMEKLKADRTILLVLKKESIKANLGYYFKFTIKEYTEPKNYNDDFDPDDNGYHSSYEKYGGYNGYDDDAIDYAFEGDPSNTWNVD